MYLKRGKQSHNNENSSCFPQRSDTQVRLAEETKFVFYRVGGSTEFRCHQVTSWGQICLYSREGKSCSVHSPPLHCWCNGILVKYCHSGVVVYQCDFAIPVQEWMVHWEWSVWQSERKSCSREKKLLIWLLLQQIELPTELQSVVGYTLRRFWWNALWSQLPTWYGWDASRLQWSSRQWWLPKKRSAQQRIRAIIAAAYWSLQATFVPPTRHDDGAPRTPTAPLYGLRYGLFCIVSQSFHPLPCIVWQLYGLPAVGGHYGWWLGALPLLQEGSPHEPQLRGLLRPLGMEYVEC